MSNTTSISPSDLALAKAFAHRVGQEVGPQLFQVTLFGSRARGDADEESDLDLFVAPKGSNQDGSKDSRRQGALLGHQKEGLCHWQQRSGKGDSAPPMFH